MAYEFIVYEQDGAVLTLTLNRPDELNSITRQVENELHAALDEADADDSVRSIVLTGAGRAFSAGYDISRGENEGSAPPRDEPDSRGEFLRAGWSLSRRNPGLMLHLMELSKPIIAAVNGWCIGGGFWYALAADITIAADNAVFAQPEVRMISNSSVLFAALVGWKNAHRYALTGDHFDAQEALRIGVVNEVVPADQLLDHAQALARRIALVPRDSVRINKAITVQGLQAMGLREALNVNTLLSMLVGASNDAPDVEHLRNAREEGGMRAFLDARDGPFRPEPFGPRSQPRE